MSTQVWLRLFCTVRTHRPYSQPPWPQPDPLLLPGCLTMQAYVQTNRASKNTFHKSSIPAVRVRAVLLSCSPGQRKSHFRQMKFSPLLSARKAADLCFMPSVLCPTIVSNLRLSTRVGLLPGASVNSTNWQKQGVGRAPSALWSSSCRYLHRASPALESELGWLYMAT